MIAFCNYCARQVIAVEVHGHAQCPVCHINIAPCCGGETACQTGVNDELKEV